MAYSIKRYENIEKIQMVHDNGSNERISISKIQML